MVIMMSKNDNSKMFASKLYKIINDQAGKIAMMAVKKNTPAFLTGEVTGVNPLKIKIENRIEVGEDTLIQSSMCKETWINVPTFNNPEHLHVVPTHYTESGGSQDPHKHEIKPFNTELAHPKIRLWRGLVVGDYVRMIQVQGGQFYYILERVDGISNEDAEDQK